jgi:Amt family ammonium transporter
MAANGLLAGLVAVTAPCAYINSSAAVFIGLVAGVLMSWGLTYVERRLKIDDTVGAIAIHGINGIWGVLSVGLFADGTYGNGLNGVAGGVTGLFYGNPAQLGAQLIGIGANLVWVLGASYAAFKLIHRLVGNRVEAEDEMQGLDISELGISAYPDFVTTNYSGMGSPSFFPRGPSELTGRAETWRRSSSVAGKSSSSEE